MSELRKRYETWKASGAAPVEPTKQKYVDQMEERIWTSPVYRMKNRAIQSKHAIKKAAEESDNDIFSVLERFQKEHKPSEVEKDNLHKLASNLGKIAENTRLDDFGTVIAAAQERLEQRRSAAPSPSTPGLQEEAGRIMDANRIRSLENKITAAEETRPGWFARTILGNDGEYDEAELAEMRRALRDAKTELAEDEYAALLRDPEFAGYIEQGRGMENPTLAALMGSMPWNYDKYIVNKATFATDNKNFFSPTTQDKYGSLMGVYADTPGDHLSEQLRFMGLMTDDEVNIYSGILNSQGEDKADEYYKYLKPELTRRAAETVVNAIEEAESPAWVRHFAGFQSGAQQAGANLEQLFNREEWVGNRAGDYVPQMLVERGLLSDTGANVSSSIGGQVPQMAANLIASPLRTLGLNKTAGAISAAVAGATASGGALRQSMGEGYSYSDAADYALASGISEAATSWILDSAGEGVNALTGGWLKRAMNGIRSPRLRGLARYGLSSASEGVEEMIQEPIGNALGNWLLDKDEKIFDAGQMLESGLAGMIAGAIMGTGNVSNYVQTERMGEAVLKTGKTDVLIEAAKSMGKDSEAAKLAQKIDPETISAKEAAELAGAFVKEGGDPAVLMPDKAEIEQGAEGSPLEDIYRRVHEQAQSVEQGEAYSRQVQRAYDAGLHGMDYEVAAAIDTEGENRLPDALMKEAYNQGVIDLASAQEAKQLATEDMQAGKELPHSHQAAIAPASNVASVPAAKAADVKRSATTIESMQLPAWTAKKGGIVQRHSQKGKLSKTQTGQLTVLNAIGKKYGAVFVVEDTINDGGARANAAYMGDNVFRIALDADGGAYIYFATHELAHYLKRQSHANYNAVMQSMQAWAEGAGIDFVQRVDEALEKYEAAGQKLSRDMAEEEVVGDIMGMIFADESTATKFLYSMPKEFLNKVADFFKDLLDTIRTAARRVGDKKGLNALLELEGWAERAAAIVDAAMVEAKNERQARKESTQNKSTNAQTEQNAEQSAEQSAEDAVRYSLKDVTEGVSVETVMDESARLQKIYDALLKKVGNINTYKGKIQSEYIEKQARKLLREFKSRFSYDTLVNNLTQLAKYYESAAKTNTLDSAFLVQMYADVMRPVLEMSEDVDKTVWEEGKELREYFKGLRFSLNGTQRAEIVSAFGSVNTFRKDNFGRFVLAQDAPNLDTLWPEIAEKFPYIFKEDVSDAEMPQMIMDAIEATRPKIYNPYGLDVGKYSVYAATRAIELMHDFPIAKTYLEAAKEAGKRKLTDYQQKESKAKLRRGIARQTNDLIRKLANPTDAKHIPEELRKPIFRALANINYTSDAPGVRHLAWQDKIEALRRVLDKNAGEFAALGVDPDIIERVQELADSIDKETRFEDMNAEQLKTLSDTMANLKRAILEYDTVFRAKKNAKISVISQEAIDYLTGRKARKINGKLAGVSDAISFSAMNARDFFTTQLGKGGEALYTILRNGQDIAHQHIHDGAKGFANIMRENGVTQSERNEWEKKIHTFTTEGGKKLQLNETQMMSLYAYSKRKQSLQHLLSEKGGIVPGKVKGRDVDSKSKNRVKVNQVRPVRLTEADIKAIREKLTKQQREVADALVEYMSTTVAEWGNAASMEMHGYRKFTEDYYIPIKTDRNSLAVRRLGDAESTLANANKNKGFTKSTSANARNPIEVDNIFDVFGKHVIEMANYDGFAPAVENILKVYGSSSDETSLRAELEVATGDQGAKYIDGLLRDINHTSKGSTSALDGVVGGLISRYKKSAVMAKPRVAIQQYTAIARALNVVNPKNLGIGLAKSMAHMKKSIKEMQEHAPIAWWKSNGNYDTHVGRAAIDIVQGNESIGAKVDNVSMWLAGALDNAAWAGIWEAVKAEIEPRGLEGEAYWDAVRERFNEVIDSTQVVDTVLHRSQMARSKSVLQLVTAFMSEPLRTYNMLRNSVSEIYRANGAEAKSAAWKKFARAASTVLINSTLHSLVLAAFDSMRYREEEKEETAVSKYFEEKYEKDKKTFASRFWENMLDDVNPVSMLPIISDAQDMFITLAQDGKQYGETNMITDGMFGIIKTGFKIKKAVEEAIEGEIRYGKRSGYGLTRDMVNYVSRAFGLPAEGVLSWVETTVNSVFPEALKTTNPDKYETLKEYIAYGDIEAAKRRVEELLAEGNEMKNIRGSITGTFKPLYQKMEEAGDTEAMQQLNKYVGWLYDDGIGGWSAK